MKRKKGSPRSTGGVSAWQLPPKGTEEQGKWRLVGKSRGASRTEANAAGAGGAATSGREEGGVLTDIM